MSDTKSSVDGTHLRAQAAAEDAGLRLDRFLAKSFPEFSRSRLEGLIDAGAVTLDAATIEDANHRVKPGASYMLAVPVPRPPRPQAQAIPLKIVYTVTRHEVKSDKPGKVSEDAEQVARFLKPDARVPITGKPLDLIKDKQLPPDPMGTARGFYDVVNAHMRYSKEGMGWGQGDSVWACDSKYGNCTDFHSLFISLARANKIPAKFEMGFPLPPRRGEGEIGGYHCWAKFLVEGKTVTAFTDGEEDEDTADRRSDEQLKTPVAVTS